MSPVNFLIERGYNPLNISHAVSIVLAVSVDLRKVNMNIISNVGKNFRGYEIRQIWPIC